MGPKHLQRRLILAFALCCVTQLPPRSQAQETPNDQPPPPGQPAEDAPGCPRLVAGFPPLPMSVVESCQKADSVEVTLPLNPDANGHPQETRVRGALDFREYRISELDREYAFANLMNLLPMAGFTVKYSNKPATITARKGDTWMLINVSRETYNVSVVVPPQEDWTPAKTAEEIAKDMNAHGRVNIYGIEFSPRDQSIQEPPPGILSQILKYLKANPDLSILIESHKISTLGLPEDDSEITRERANAVMDWLIAHGISRSRLQARPCGRDNPIADNESPSGAQRNERIVLVKASS